MSGVLSRKTIPLCFSNIRGRQLVLWVSEETVGVQFDPHCDYDWGGNVV